MEARTILVEYRTCVECGEYMPRDSFHKHGIRCFKCKPRKKTRGPAAPRSPVPVTFQSGHKVCRKCIAELPFEDFSAAPKNKDGLQSYCKTCRSTHSRSKYDPAKGRAYALRFNYRITQARFDEMVEAQGGLCASCGQAPPPLTGGRNGSSPKTGMHIDHDHATGEVRALLCHGCNSAAGNLKDDPLRAEALAAYLRKHGH